MKRLTVPLIAVILFSLPGFLLTAGADKTYDSLLMDPEVPELHPSVPDGQYAVFENLICVNDEFVEEESVLENDGTGPVAGTNKIYIYIASTPSTAGSEAEYIYMDFGPDDHLRLLGFQSGTPFPLGAGMVWDLSSPDIEEFMESLNQESWDYVTLRTVSSDGIKINRIKIEHSSETILDWYYKDWLDSPNDSHVGLAAKILHRQMKDLKLPLQAAVNFGLRDLGKTNGYKYGTGSAWCSEFASWCLRKDGWDTPTGSFGTSNMRNFFDELGRLYTQSQILNGTYVPQSGDYFSLWDGGHSVIIAYWVDDISGGISTGTQFKTIEGNCGQAVRTVTRTVADIDHVGKAQ